MQTDAKRAALIVAGMLWMPAGALVAQGDPDHEWCRGDRRGSRDGERYCEVRTFELPADRGAVRVNAGTNGGISVEGWDRDDIRVLAKVQVWSRRDDPEELARAVTIRTDGTIRAEGPERRRSRRDGVAVSFRLMVPRRSDLDLETLNGGINVFAVHGDIEFRAVNGGISLNEVGGDLRGRTTNGGVHIELEGDRWDGAGLDVETTNGGITLGVPEDFHADLTTGTVNGGLDIDFPVTIQGRINRRRITTKLNGGGPPVRVVTVNGGVTIRRH